MSRIITLPPARKSDLLSPLHLQSLSCWHFAYAALWAEQPLSKHETDSAVMLVRDHLAVSSPGAFMNFCERILLARSQILTEPSAYLPQPGIWLHPNYEEGYNATQVLHEQMKQKRELIPGYRQEISILAKYYYRYQTAPSKACFDACRRKLLQIKAYGLLQLFYQAIVYSQYF
jgi:hypothetical protein